jgi:hypothetical protein
VYWAAVTSSTRENCQSLVESLHNVPQRVISGQQRSELPWADLDGRTVLVRWGTDHVGSVPEDGAPECSTSISCETGVARVNPVYIGHDRRGWIVSNRASLIAAALGKLQDISATFVASFANFEFGIDGESPWNGIEVADASTRIVIGGGNVKTASTSTHFPNEAQAPADCVARALVDSVGPLRRDTGDVVLSLTGGKDSRLVAAALKVAGVNFTTRTHGAPDHPDVIAAGAVARALGVVHEILPPPVREESGARFLDVDVEARLRSTVLLSDGQLSAFENLGRESASTSSQPRLGGQGGELLRGGYAKSLVGHRRSRAPDFYRRLAYKRIGLLTNVTRRRYMTSSSTRWLARTAVRNLNALDDFYLANRAGRWSAAARSVLLLRSPVVQPFFADGVIVSARRAPIEQRIEDRLIYEVLHRLVPALVDIPFANDKWAFLKASARASGPSSAAPSTAVRARTRDWRTSYGTAVAQHFRDYVLANNRLFDFLDRSRVERVLREEPQDARTVWCIATLTMLVSGNWLQKTHVSSTLPVPMD